MAPLPSLLESARARSSDLEKAQQEQKTNIASLEAEIAAKREEKSIAGQEAVRDLLKKKEAATKESKQLAGALSLIGRAVAKLQKATELELSDWTRLHTEKLKLSGFAEKKLQEDPKALEGLRSKCGRSGLELKGDYLEFTGDKAVVAKLKQAVEDLEANYEIGVDIDDDDTFKLLDSRDEIGSLVKRHQVNMSQEGTRLIISGPPKSAEKVADMIKAMMAGKEDLDCPKNLVGAAKGKAKDVETESGAIIAVWNVGGWNGSGVIYIRGLPDCVQEASDAFRVWLDEREGCTSEFVEVDSGSWAPSLADQFKNDSQMMGQKFGVAVKPTSVTSRLELRGLPDAVAAANKEMQMILEFYQKEQAKVEKQKAAEEAEAAVPAEEPEDEWGAAPVAEPAPAAW